MVHVRRAGQTQESLRRRRLNGRVGGDPGGGVPDVTAAAWRGALPLRWCLRLKRTMVSRLGMEAWTVGLGLGELARCSGLSSGYIETESPHILLSLLLNTLLL